MPSVLFLATHLWSRGVPLNVRFAIRLCDFIISGASVILGMVMISTASIILCCALCALLVLSTLRSAGITGGGWRSACTYVYSKRNKCLPLGVTFTGGAKLESLLVRAHRCWCGDMSVIGNGLMLSLSMSKWHNLLNSQSLVYDSDRQEAPLDLSNLLPEGTDLDPDTWLTHHKSIPAFPHTNASASLNRRSFGSKRYFLRNL